MIAALERLTEGLRAKVQLMVGRAIITAVSDAGAIQTAQVRLLAGETLDDVERIQEYGFTSVPLPGAEGVAVFVGGNRDHGLIIATDDRRYRLKGLQGGEVALYSDEGDTIIFKRGNNLEINTQTLTVKAGTKVRLETPQLEVTGEIKDRCDSTGKAMSDMRGSYNSHTHTDPQGGTVGTASPAM